MSKENSTVSLNNVDYIYENMTDQQKAILSHILDLTKKLESTKLKLNKSSFENVEIIKAANIYFDGKVTSRKVKFSDGVVKTLGIMMPGSFEFGTEQDELMEITAGEMDILLPGKTEWQTIHAGESFKVSAKSSFKLKVKSVVDYCCSYS